MKTATHTFKTATGQVTISLQISRMSGVEAVDIYNLNARFFDAGGWKIKGFINGNVCGTEYVRNDCAHYLKNDAEVVALGFIDPSAVFDRYTADVAEYSVMYGIPFDAALGIAVLCGQFHIHQHITSRTMMPC